MVFGSVHAIAFFPMLLQETLTQLFIPIPTGFHVIPVSPETYKSEFEEPTIAIFPIPLVAIQ